MSTPNTSGSDQAPGSPRENQRLAALHALQVLDTPREATFDDITALVADICQTPMALITLIDETRQWFKSAIGIEGEQTPRETAFCLHALDNPDLLLVPDATRDPRFASNPYVTDEPHIRFYAGAPLITPEGHALGTLCVVDRVPRQLTERQLTALRVLGRQVMTELQLRRRLLDFGRAEQALRQSEREQRILVQNLETQRARLLEAQAVAKVGSWETDLADMSVSWSEQTHRIFETDPATFAPTHAGFLELVHPEDRAAVDRALQQSLATGGAHAIEHRLLLPGGRLKFVEEHWQVIGDPTGRPLRATGTCQEITERKLADLALRESNEKFHQLADNISDAFWIRSPDMQDVEYLSPAFEKIWGRSRADLLAKPARWVDFILPEDRARVQAAFAGLRQDTPSVNLEYRIVWPGGEVRWVRVRGFQVRDQTGRLIRLTGTASDITERKQADEVLRNNEALLRMASEVSRLGAWRVRLPGMQMIWSEEVGIIHETPRGFTPGVDQGIAFYAPEYQARVRKVFEECVQTGQPFDEELEIITARGTRRWVRVLGEVGRDATGRITQVQGAIQDISERKAAEARLRREESLMELAGKVSKAAGWSLTVPDLRLYWSRQVWEMVDYPVGQEPALDRLLQYYLPDSRKKLSQAITRCARHGQAFDLELQLTTPTGRAMWARVAGEADRDAQGRIQAVHGAFSDITARKQAEDELRRLARRLTVTLESITDAFFTLDHEWRFTYLNSEAERLLLRPAADLLGRHIWEEFPAAVGSLFQREYERAVRDNVTVGFEAYYPAPLDRWYGVRAYPSEEGLGVYFQDITATRQVREDLRVSEERFREMAENIGDVFYNFDPVNGRLLYASPAYEKIWGRPLADIYSDPMGYLDHIDPADRPAAQAAFDRQLKGGETTADFRAVHPDGTVRWVREHAVPVLDDQGRVERIVGTMRDITESRQASEELRKSEERYRLLFANNPHPMWVFDLESLCILAVNTAAVEHYGYSEAEFLAMRVIDLRAPEDAITFEDAIAWLPPVGKATALRRHRRKDGTVIEVESTSDSVVLAGRPARLVLADDVTERRRAEAKLREQAALLDKAQDAIIVRDLEHRITYWNKSAERLYGWTAAEALGRSARELLYFDPENFDRAMVQLQGGSEWTGELVQRRKDGGPLTIEGRWTLVRDEAGRPRSVLAINTDITERKKLEQQFLRAQRMESIGTLAGGIAHDLNNLLAPITMGVDLLKLFDPPPKSLPVIENIERSAKRGSELVKQVLSFARGVEGARVTLQLRHILTEVESIAVNTFPKNIAVETRLPGDLWPVRADPTQLNQVVMNLCVNARDAMPRGGRLELAASNIEVDAQYAVMNRGMAPGRYVVIQVSDTGIGMPPEIIERIFEPFFTTKEMGKGTGLGLSTVLGIVRSHGGFVNVYSEVGHGSTFKVYLPADEGGDGAGADHPAEASLPRGHGELILVVDDETAILDITRQTLQAFGYRVVTAEDGAQAVSLYAQQRDEIALVLTDMMMPLMDGATLILALRRINPRIRVIAASGLKGTGDVTRATHVGVKHFLAKPYSADTMLQLVSQVLHDGGSRPPV